MADIFISYSRKDTEYVEWIKPTLVRLRLETGVKYFQDIDNIQPGEDFEDCIKTFIENATIIICFLSRNLFASTFIQEHELPLIEQGFNKGVRIIPIIVDDVYINPESIFSRVQNINLHDKTLLEIKTNNNISVFVIHLEKHLRQELKKFPRIQKNNVETRYNIVVVGKAGVGKSALINYLFGDDVARSSTGKPVTDIGFHQTDFNLAGIPASIYDSAGLEVGNSNYDIWMERLEDELGRRGPTESITKWFHTVIYCIQATGNRIEQSELEIINKFINKKYKVIIVITKSYISRDNIDILTTAIKDNIGVPIKCILINSRDEEMYDGGIVKKYGKAALSKEIQVSLIESLTDRIPARCIGFMENNIDKWRERQIEYIDNNLSAIPRNNMAEKLEKEFGVIIKEIKDSDGEFSRIIIRETKNTLSVYSEIIGVMEQSFLFEERGFIPILSDNPRIDKIKSFGKRFDELMNEFYDWDHTEDYGTFVDTALKIVTLPIALIASFFDGITNHINEVSNWRNKTVERINKYGEYLKTKLQDSEEEIKRFYADRIRDL